MTTPAQTTDLSHPGHPFLRVAVRNKLRTELGKKVARREASHLLSLATDVVVDDAATSVGVALPAGGFVQWLIDHQAVIMQVVMLIMAAFGL